MADAPGHRGSALAGVPIWPELPTRARASLEWLLRSERPGGGSAAFYAPLRGWSKPYPETTGYIVPTLYAGGARFGDRRYEHAAERMAYWLLGIQDDAGWFPAGTWGGGAGAEPSIFNTGQIVFGLLAAFRHTGEDEFASASRRAVDWLRAELDEDGHWSRHAYRPGYVPSYYAHVCWPMAEHWRIFGGDGLGSDVVRALDAILEDRRDDGTFARWSFDPGQPAYTHTIAYTLQGLLEAGRILGLSRHRDAAIGSLTRLMRRYEIGKRLAGAYGPRWKPVGRFICLTGHCQLASAWLGAFQLSGDPRYVNVALRALHEVGRHQRLRGRDAKRGALAGSHPVWGPYMRGRYPNWAAKFHVDALLGAEDVLEGGLAVRRELPR